MGTLDITEHKLRGGSLIDKIEDLLAEYGHAEDFPDKLLVTKTQFRKLRDSHKLHGTFLQGKFILLTERGVLEVHVT